MKCLDEYLFIFAVIGCFVSDVEEEEPDSGSDDSGSVAV
jgi:hypothetical protein